MLKLVLVLCLCLFRSQVLTSPSPIKNVNNSSCEEVGDCMIENEKCDDRCDCEGSTALILTFNETLGECVLNYKQLLQSLGEKYNTQGKIQNEVERVFQGVMISVALFITCAGVGFVAACVYCCRIGYMDNELKKDVDALENKLKRDGILKKSTKAAKQQSNSASETCNIIVEDAGVYVV